MGVLKKLNAALRKIERFIVSAGILVIGFLTILNVIYRNVLNHSLSFAQEINGFAIVFVTFLGTAYAAREGRHIRMSALFDILPKKYKKIMLYIMTSLTSLILFYLTFLSGKYIMNVHQHHRVSSVLQVPLYLVWMAVPIGLFIAAIQYALAFIRNINEEEIWISFDKKSEYADVEEEVAEVNTDAIDDLKLEVEDSE